MDASVSNWSNRSHLDNVHLLPCRVEHDGPAATSAYFSPLIETEIEDKEHGDTLLVTFRGRTLRGTKVKLPVGYSGVVLREAVKARTDKMDRTLAALHKFDEL